MSHELRTPLNAIINYSEMLHEDATDAEQDEFLPDLERIQTAGRHLLRLINNILDISKIESGRMDVYPENFDIGEVVSDVETMVQPLVAKNGNALVVDCPPEVGSMHSDLTKVRQCLVNLLSNASKFTENGEVRCTVRRERAPSGEVIRFMISDTGIGMTQEQLESVFQAFQQADETITRRYGGTGLGLAITRSFSHMLGGDVTVTSEAGKGSTFTITLPARYLADTDVAEAAGTLVTEGSSAAGVTVLLIDDERAVHERLEDQFNGSPYQLLHAFTGKQGLAMAHEKRPDIVLLDILIPSLDGWGVLNALKKDPETAHIPVVILTKTKDHELAFSLGAADFITKPVDADELLRRLDQFRSPDDSTHILVIDDDSGSRAMLRRVLERNDWRVIEAANGKDGLAHLAQSLPVAVLLDLIMPEMDGFQFIDELRQNPDWVNVSVLVITSKDLSAEERLYLQRTTERIVQKGELDRTDLLATIAKTAASGPLPSSGAGDGGLPTAPR